jgi:uncharacterized protein YbaP (TraB family)
MKRTTIISLLVTLIFLFTTNLFSQNTLLWEISGNGLSAPSYLFGTIHIADKRAYQFNDSVLPKLNECQAFAMEINMDSVDETSLLGKMMIEDGKTLEDIYSKKDYKMIKAALKKSTGFDISLFNSVKPFVILTMIEASKPAKSSMEDALDIYLSKQAKDKGKKVIGIETIDEQMDVISKMPPGMVIDYIKNMGKQDKMTEQLIDAYSLQQLDKIKSIMDNSGNALGAEFNKEILTKRNYIMADRISTFIASETLFIAIGSGHLPGDEGVISLLKKKGFTVSPIIAPHTNK